MNGSANDNLALDIVVIDAGHGGTDPGAVSRDGRTYEKTLTLDISKKLAEKIREEFPDVKVILSRPDDKFVALEGRAACANKAGADLFLSVHINSTKSTSPNGFSVHTLGQSSNKDRDLFAYNMDVCRQENSVALLEQDYNTKYQGFDPSDPESMIFMQLMQNSHLEQSLDFAQIISEKLATGPIKANRGIWQNPFLVLWKTAMPSVLVELGFISNSSDLEILKKDGERDRIAGCLLEAFREYKNKYDASVTIGREGVPETGNEVLSPTPVKTVAPAPEKTENPVTVKETPVQVKTETSSADVRYGTQIMSGRTRLSSHDKQFLGFEPEIIEVNGIYKYVIGVCDTPEEAKEKFNLIRKTYPGAFLVVLSNGVFPYSQTTGKGN